MTRKIKSYIANPYCAYSINGNDLMISLDELVAYYSEQVALADQEAEDTVKTRHLLEILIPLRDRFREGLEHGKEKDGHNRV
jgi:hypothetical protein